MNYYGPRELLKDGKGTGLYHYTCMNDGKVWPVGYCSPTEVCACFAARMQADPDCETCKGRGLVDVPNPCPGHKTEVEACEHYRQYELDKHLRFQADDGKGETQHKCAECGAWTQGFASIGTGCPTVINLCNDHQNRGVVEKLYGPVGTSAES